ncbi:hypothetical protein BJ165DRAFT_1529208 [Panaeolus papilionaceus]|nr:hypothetical protein BJ165DRAFT_1529208 [Panaeolus papilionaceus]
MVTYHIGTVFGRQGLSSTFILATWICNLSRDAVVASRYLLQSTVYNELPVAGRNSLTNANLNCICFNFSLTNTLPTFATTLGKRKPDRKLDENDTPTQAFKRLRASNPAAQVYSPTSSTPNHPPNLAILSDHDKLEHLYDVLKKFRWTLGDLLHHIFQHVGSKKVTGRSLRNSAAVSKLLKGQTGISLGSIINYMYTHPSGLVNTDEAPNYFEDYTRSNVSIRVVLRSFAV